MVSYADFKETAVGRIVSFMPEEFKDYEAVACPANKVNGTIDQLTLAPPARREIRLLPAFSLKDMYEEYRDRGDLDAVLEAVASGFVEYYGALPETGREIVFKNDPGRIIMQLINTGQNRELLAGCPHREHQDLSIVYRYVADMDEDRVASALICGKLAEQIGMTEQELYAAAFPNTARLFPPTIQTVEEALREMFGEQGPTLGSLTGGTGGPEGKGAMYMLSNERKTYGATSILFDGELHKIAEKYGGDLYVLPSSIHEAMVVPASANDPYELAKMVGEINMDHVSPEERLSGQVYHYDRERRQLSLATDALPMVPGYNNPANNPALEEIPFMAGQKR